MRSAGFTRIVESCFIPSVTDSHPMSAPLVHRRLLWSWLERAQVQRWASPALGQLEPRDARRLWEGHADAQAYAAKLPPLAPPAPLAPHPREEKILARLRENPRFEPAFGDRPVRVAEVPLEDLVVFQPAVTWTDDRPPLETEEWFLPTRGVTRSQVVQEGPDRFVVMTTDPNSLLEASVEPGRGITVKMSARENWLQVVEVEGRRILLNGLHRSLASWRSGQRRVVALVEASSRRELPSAAPDCFGWDLLLEADRPPVVGDFFEARLVRDWQGPAVRRLLVVKVQADEIRVPV